MSSHFAFFSFPAYAHVAPTLPLVAELTRRGHRVTYVATERFAPDAAAAGADVLTYESAFPWATGPGDPADAGHAARLALAFLAEGLAPLAMVGKRFLADPPDLFAHDAASSESARLLARACGRPVVQLCPTFASGEPFRMNDAQAACADQPVPAGLENDPSVLSFARQARSLLGELGLAHVDIAGFGADDGNNIVFLPREFQPCGAGFCDRYAFIGPCQGEAEAVTDWEPPADGRPLVLISLGTSHSAGQAAFFRKCVAAFSGQPWNVVLTLGSWVEPTELGPVGGNIVVRPFIPHPAVLRHAKVFVTHAGMSSVMESFMAGVPMVAVPHHVDQRVIAGQVAALGTGEVLDRARMSEQDLLEAVGKLAADRGAAGRARIMGEHARSAGGPVRGADLLEKWKNEVLT